MKKISITIFTLFLFAFCTMSQTAGVKTNFAHWGVAATPNVGLEFSLGRKYTLELGAGYNPFTFKNNMKFKHWIFQPELRYWTCESFNGHFFGLHAVAAEYNVGGFDIPVGRLKELKDHRYEGYAFGGGLSYGYQLPVAKRFNLEFNIGVGYARLLYDKYKCIVCGEVTETDSHENYLGVTKAAVSLIYLIK